MADHRNGPDGVPWGAIDSALALVAPRQAAARYAAKVAIANLRRGYEAGGKTRVTEGWRGSNASADAEIAAVGPVLRDRSRDLVRNNALAAQAVQVLVNNIVGPGIRPRAASGNKALNKRVDALWRSFAANCDFYGHTDFHGLTIGDTTFKSHIDGYNLVPALTGDAEWPRESFIYWTDGAEVAALRYGDWKATFLIQRAEGLHVWLEPFVELRTPILTNLRMDPFELASEHGMDYERWFLEHMFMIAPAAAYVGETLQTFAEFPPRQEPGTFNLSVVIESIMGGIQR